ncbi:hypothetical protein [Halorussus sp. AFM4]|uniref:hypothetical protein n=1 Tax=Halorussus sp. AFM4 TaxID=3421651 RepID=UPI003EB6D5FC
MSDDSYPADAYDEEEVGDTRGVREEEVDDPYDDTLLPLGGSMYPFSWPFWATDEDDVYEDESFEGAEYDGADAERDDGAGWDVGVIGTLLLVGLALFLIPEPTTSAIGIFLISLGVVAWVVDWLL